MNLVVVDYSLGNLFSVQQACLRHGHPPVVTADPQVVRRADAVILPGVGAFGEAMDNLRRTGLDQALREVVDAGKPLMGICLGMQLLFGQSEEFGAAEGLGFLPGTIRRLPSEGGRKIPQIAWNQIHPGESDWQASPLKDLEDGDFVYFVHSYFVEPGDRRHLLTETDYDGFRYCSAVQKENIFATQFHPEKSAAKGLTIYRNWLEQI